MAPVARLTLLEASEHMFCMVRMAQTRSSNVFDLPQFNNVRTHFGLDASRAFFDPNREKLHNISIYRVCNGLSGRPANRMIQSSNCSFKHNLVALAQCFVRCVNVAHALN